MDAFVDELVKRVPAWAGVEQLKTSLLAGGITNRNYRVDVADESFVLRVSGKNTRMLGIDRAQEHAANRAAADIRVAPEVVYFIEPEGYLVTRFVEGRPLPPAEMRRPENIHRVAAALQQIHALPPISATFSPFQTVRDYTEIARRYDVEFPGDFDWFLERMRAVEAAFGIQPFTPRLCHNDLLNENFLDDGRLRILDWEYAGMGDVAFDLANFAVHHGLSDEQDRLLLESYYRQATPLRLARHKLMKIISDFREAMWGMVQIGISKLDFDFQGYADKHFARMAENFGDPRCEAWLAAFD